MRGTQLLRRGFLATLLVAIAYSVATSANYGQHASVSWQRDTVQAGTLSFTDISFAAGLSQITGGHGAAFADVDLDGLSDLYVTLNDVRSGFRSNHFYRNVGGSFVEEQDGRGIAVFGAGSHGASWADIDNDGDFDLVVGVTYGSLHPTLPAPASNRIYRNDNGVFADVTPPAMRAYEDYTRSILALDFDRDNDLDVFAVNGEKGAAEDIADRNELYRNDRTAGFTAITTGVAISAPAGQGASDTDYDGDGDMDIIAANRFAPVNVLRNDGAGVFTAVSPASIGIGHFAAAGITTGDIDNDGDLDLLLVDLVATAVNKVHLYRNNGNGTYTYIVELSPVGGYTAGLADLDNDTDLDMVVPGFGVVLVNDGTGAFSYGPAYPGPGIGRDPDPRTIAFSDIDGDGDSDFAITTKASRTFLFRNNFDAGNWLKVRLVSPQGQAGAFGAKVRVRAPGGALLGLREARSNFGYLAQDDPVLHFGLGSATTVDVEVTFGDGSRVTRTAVSGNQTIMIGGSGISPPGQPQNLVSSVAGSTITLQWAAPATGAPLTSYVLEAGSVAGVSNLASVTLGSSSRQFSANAPPGLYYFRIRARNTSGVGGPSNELGVRVGSGCQSAPQPPTTLTQTVNGLQLTLAWTAAGAGESTDSYVIEAGSQSQLSNLAQVDIGNATSFSASAPPGTYFVRVRGRNACGISAPSNEVIVRVGCQGAPLAPGTLTHTVVGSQVTLTWSPPAGGDSASGYILEAGSQSGAGNLAQVETGSTSLAASAPPGTYFVRVRARNACGSGAASNEVVVRVN